MCAYVFGAGGEVCGIGVVVVVVESDVSWNDMLSWHRIPLGAIVACTYAAAE